MVGIMQAPGDPKKKKLLTPKRVNEIADSLDYESHRKSSGGFQVLMDKSIKDREDIYKRALSESQTDAANAARYRKLAQAKSKK
jgi:hypothetical protein